MTAVRQKTRRGGGRRMRAERQAGARQTSIPDPVYTRLINPYPPIEQFSADQIEAIHLASLTILEEIGIRVLSEEARELYQAAFPEREREGDRKTEDDQ